MAGRQVRENPTNTHAQNDLGVAWQARGKRAEAEAAYRRAIALDPFSFTTHLNLALLLRGMNRAAEASQEFYQARHASRRAATTKRASPKRRLAERRWNLKSAGFEKNNGYWDAEDRGRTRMNAFFRVRPRLSASNLRRHNAFFKTR